MLNVNDALCFELSRLQYKCQRILWLIHVNVNGFLWLTSLLLAVNSVHKILDVSFSLELRKVAATFTVCLSVCGMNFKKKAKWLLTAVVFMVLCFVLFHPALLHNFLSNTFLDFMFETHTKDR